MVSLRTGWAPGNAFHVLRLATNTSEVRQRLVFRCQRKHLTRGQPQAPLNRSSSSISASPNKDVSLNVSSQVICSATLALPKHSGATFATRPRYDTNTVFFSSGWATPTMCHESGVGLCLVAPFHVWPQVQWIFFCKAP